MMRHTNINIVIYIGTIDAPYKNEDILYEKLKKIGDHSLPCWL